LRWWTHY